MSLGGRERILLKISGGNLKQEGDKGFFSNSIINNLVDQIKFLLRKYDVAIVCGGGNIWRGHENNLSQLESGSAHYLGILATLMNAIVLQNYLNDKGVRSTIFSAFSSPRIAEEINPEKINRALDAGEVVIFAGGTGMPFVSTDTCASIRAIEIGAKKVLIGKDKVKGVYDKDPKKYKDAVFFPVLTYEEIISRKLSVLDQTALTLLSDFRLELFIFNQNEPDSFVKSLNDEIEYTKII